MLAMGIADDVLRCLTQFLFRLSIGRGGKWPSGYAGLSVLDCRFWIGGLWAAGGKATGFSIFDFGFAIGGKSARQGIVAGKCRVATLDGTRAARACARWSSHRESLELGYKITDP